MGPGLFPCGPEAAGPGRAGPSPGRRTCDPAGAGTLGSTTGPPGPLTGKLGHSDKPSKASSPGAANAETLAAGCVSLAESAPPPSSTPVDSGEHAAPAGGVTNVRSRRATAGRAFERPSEPASTPLGGRQIRGARQRPPRPPGANARRRPAMREPPSSSAQATKSPTEHPARGLGEPPPPPALTSFLTSSSSSSESHPTRAQNLLPERDWAGGSALGGERRHGHPGAGRTSVQPTATAAGPRAASPPESPDRSAIRSFSTVLQIFYSKFLEGSNLQLRCLR